MADGPPGDEEGALEASCDRTEELTHLLQALLTHQSLLDEEPDDEGAAPPADAADEPPLSPSATGALSAGMQATATLRGWRRAPGRNLAEMTQEGFVTMMNGTLYEYDERSAALPYETLGQFRPLQRPDFRTTLSFLETSIMSQTGGFGESSAASPSSTSRSGFWQQGNADLDETQSLEMGGDGYDTFYMHGLLRRMVRETDMSETLARSARRVLMLGAVARGQRLSDEEVAALPKVRFNDAENQDCSICLETYRQGEMLTALRCSHIFHTDCLARWFQQSTQCPLCRARQQGT